MNRRAAPLLAVAAAGALVVALLTPATHGTFSAAVETAGAASVTPFLTCAAAAAAEQARGDLVFAYPLADAADATQAADVSGSGLTADYSGKRLTTRKTPGGCLRDGGTAWSPDGESSGLTTPDVVLEHRFTFEIRFRTAQSSAVIASITPQGTDQTYSLAILDGSAALLAPGGQPVLRGGPAVGDDAWHHLALVVEDDAIRLWIDSADVASQPFRLSGRFGARWRLAIGGPDGQRLPVFQGALAWAQLMNRPLDPAEVHAHDLAGRAPAIRVRPPRTLAKDASPAAEATAATPEGRTTELGTPDVAAAPTEQSAAPDAAMQQAAEPQQAAELQQGTGG